MEGPATWSQIIWLAGIIGTSVVFGGSVMLWIMALTKRDRHTIRSHFDQHITLLEERIEMLEDKIEGRVRAIEIQNASTMVILQHVDDFKREVNSKLDDIREDRRADMEQLNSMIVALHNKASFKGG